MNGNELALLMEELTQQEPPQNSLYISSQTLDDVAFHDFSFFEFLLEPAATIGRGRRPNISDHAAAYLDELENAGMTTEALDYVAGFLVEMETILDGAVRDSRLDPHRHDAYIQEVLTSLYVDYPYLVRRIMTLANERPDFMKRYFYGRINDLASQWEAYAPRYQPYADHFNWPEQFLTHWAPLLGLPRSLADLEYPFEAFPNYSINAGLRVTYRQVWRPLGIQPGEIVRTIPLGPGQTERISTKITRRQKQVSSLESVTEIETTTETSETTKDSSEIASEAASSSNWNVAAEVSGGIGFISGGVSTSVGGSSNDSRKYVASSLSEAMQKTASKMRRETKVTVSTERESTFEEERASEISNSNNEVAVTYVYHKLQQQYEVHTYLAEVQSVIFVAEHLPSPVEINSEWVRRYDWIIAKVLKDESFREILNELIQDVEDDELVSSSSQNPFAELASTAKSSFATFTSTGPGGPGQGGLALPDIYSEPLRLYGQHLKDADARRRANDLRRLRYERLFQHIRDHVLHYCRAIWAHEDPDQRLLRYKKEGRQVPTQWRAPMVASTSGTVQLTPTGATAPLWEVIDPTGPIGYSGNYAIFALRSLAEEFTLVYPGADDGVLGNSIGVIGGDMVVTLQRALAMMRARYTRQGRLYDPARDDFLKDVQLMLAADPQLLDKLSDEDVFDILSYLPRLAVQLLDANGNVNRNAAGQLVNPPSVEDWANYLLVKSATRRFLVDSNNLFLSLHIGEGSVLEPFKRIHRYVDVLRAQEQVNSERLKNERRAAHMASPSEYDPDIEKVIILEDGAASNVGTTVAIHETEGNTLSEPVGTEIGASSEVDTP